MASTQIVLHSCWLLLVAYCFLPLFAPWARGWPVPTSLDPLCHCWEASWSVAPARASLEPGGFQPQWVTNRCDKILESAKGSPFFVNWMSQSYPQSHSFTCSMIYFLGWQGKGRDESSQRRRISLPDHKSHPNPGVGSAPCVSLH